MLKIGQEHYVGERCSKPLLVNMLSFFSTEVLLYIPVFRGRLEMYHEKVWPWFEPLLFVDKPKMCDQRSSLAIYYKDVSCWP